MDSRELSTFLLPDGRTLAYATYGSPLIASLHPPVFYFHGFPSSRIEGALWHEAAQKLKVHVIAIDRPGMGHSTFQKNRRLLDWPKDVIALADHLNIREFGLLGASGGGPYVLGCLSVIPKERLKAGCVICGVCPLNLGSSGMLFQSRALLWGGRWMPWVVRPILDWQLGSAARDLQNPAKFNEMIKMRVTVDGMPDVDKEHFRRMFKNQAATTAFLDSVRESLRDSASGAIREAGILGGPWDFKLTEVDGSRLIMLHGVMDANVPIEMADKAASITLPAVYKRFDKEGHASLPYAHQEEILLDLISKISLQ